MSGIDKYKNNVLALQAWQEGYEQGLEQCEITSRTVWYTIVFACVLILVLLVSGCKEAYRYPCQDPANHNSKECKSPVCEADETCSNYLVEVIDENKSR